MRIGTVFKILGVLAAIAAVAGLAAYYQRYVTARAEVHRLEVERDSLVIQADEMAAEMSRLRETGDTIGTTSEEANAATEASMERLDEEVEEALEEAERELDPEGLAAVVRIDSLRIAQLDSMEVIHQRDQLTILRLEEQLFRERQLHDQEMEIARQQISNLEDQRDAFRQVAQTGWVHKLKGAADIAGLSFVAGIAFDQFVVPRL